MTGIELSLTWVMDSPLLGFLRIVRQIAFKSSFGRDLVSAVNVWTQISTAKLDSRLPSIKWCYMSS